MTNTIFSNRDFIMYGNGDVVKTAGVLDGLISSLKSDIERVSGIATEIEIQEIEIAGGNEYAVWFKNDHESLMVMLKAIVLDSISEDKVAVWARITMSNNGNIRSADAKEFAPEKIIDRPLKLALGLEIEQSLPYLLTLKQCLYA